ncbi:Lon protease mitochondrial [Cichlidogyrus casuarinus]|uniref:Lon protease mitochondrial n=1 Tax=Cichlidogyrus casuarinus TaxID=1844966 RepID=A0ABD2PZF6_9PLAT
MFQYLIPQAEKDSGLQSQQLTISESALNTLIKRYCRESGVRNLQKHIEKIVRKCVFKMVNAEVQPPIRIDEEKDLIELLGQPVWPTDRLYELDTPPGVVMGLAWTAMGGSVLYIECANKPSTKDSGALQLTGSLGKVMQESVSIAHTFAMKFASLQAPCADSKLISPDEAESASKFLAKSQLHLHVPQGATPKDGPSAGITMVTALLSLALKRPVRMNLAMTGEVSLTGKVLPVGGIKEKVIAAKRSGVDCIIMPEYNRKDFDDLQDFIKSDLQVHFVSNYSEVFPIAFASRPN